jgi:hypothetical protein
MTSLHIGVCGFHDMLARLLRTPDVPVHRTAALSTAMLYCAGLLMHSPSVLCWCIVAQTCTTAGMTLNKPSNHSAGLTEVQLSWRRLCMQTWVLPSNTAGCSRARLVHQLPLSATTMPLSAT